MELLIKQVLFLLSWRLGPILALVIIATAATAANYKKQTKVVEGKASKALSSMVAVADQAFRAITTVRCEDAGRGHGDDMWSPMCRSLRLLAGARHSSREARYHCNSQPTPNQNSILTV